MLNHVDDAKRREALRARPRGRLYDLGRVLDETRAGVPRAATSARRSSRRPITPTGRRRGREPRQLDHRAGHRHAAARHAPRRAEPPADRRPRLQRLDASPSSPAPPGVTRLGVETVPQIVTRGWLVDVPRRRRRPGDVIGVADLAGIDPAPATRSSSTPAGARTGTSPTRYLAGEPGPAARSRSGSPSAASRSPAATPGATARCRPRTRRARSRCRRSSTSRHGVFIVENLDTSALAADGVREFALILTHPKLRGATGAWTSPIALV